MLFLGSDIYLPPVFHRALSTTFHFYYSIIK
nr:MAG TPA: hypothetical protein [Caudoviricetes sp.]